MNHPTPHPTPEPKRCIGCGAPVKQDAPEGEGLPCGH